MNSKSEECFAKTTIIESSLKPYKRNIDITLAMLAQIPFFEDYGLLPD